MFGLGPVEITLIFLISVVFYIGIPVAVVVILYRLYRRMKRIEDKLDGNV